jgi:transcription elongation factor Elf1
MEQTQAYKLDLTKIDGDGDFSCPRCGSIISPNETAENTYCILDAKVNSHGLEELVISCKKCESHIHLTGFSLLDELAIE